MALPRHVALADGGSVETVRGEVVRGGQIVAQLTPLDLALFAYLVERPGLDLSRETLATEVLGQGKAAVSRAVDSAIFRLRSKLEPDPTQPLQLITVQGIGYRWVTSAASPGSTNVPPPREELLGREALLEEGRGRLQEGALVTLVGPPGIGKTTLAHAIARAHRPAGGAWWVELAAARSSEAILSGVARALGIPDTEADTDDAIAYALAHRGSVLLLLDDVEACSASLLLYLERWRRAAPRARWLLTSRAPLGAPMEDVLSVPPLADEVAHQLFVLRARSVRSGWAPADAELPALRALVAQLDGIPLALELAASRVGTLSPSQILARLSERLLLLRRPGRERQAALLATVESSWELLGTTERSVFAALSVFVGPFDLEAAASVVGSEARAHLDELCRRSLVSAADSGHFKLLESLKAYAWSQLAELGPDDAAQRHAAWFTRGAEDAATDVIGPKGPHYARQLRDRAPELRAIVQRFLGVHPEWVARAIVISRPGVVRVAADPAMDDAIEPTWAALAPDAPQWLWTAMACAGGYAARHRGRIEEARAWLERAARCAQGDPFRELWVAADHAALATVTGQFEESVAVGEAASERARQLGHHRLLGRLLGDLAIAYKRSGQLDAAARTYQAALAMIDEHEVFLMRPLVLGNLGVLDAEQGRTELARKRFEEAASAHLAAGNRRSAAVCWQNLGQLADDSGEVELAVRYLVETLAVMQQTGSRRVEGIVRTNLGGILARAGRTDEGWAHLDLGLRIAQETSYRPGEAAARGEMAGLALLEGDLPEATRQLQQALEAGDGSRLEALHRALLGGLLAHIDDPRSEEALARAAQLATQLGDPDLHVVLDRVRRWIALHRGQPVEIPEERPGLSGPVRLVEQLLRRNVRSD